MEFLLLFSKWSKNNMLQIYNYASMYPGSIVCLSNKHSDGILLVEKCIGFNYYNGNSKTCEMQPAFP